MKRDCNTGTEFSAGAPLSLDPQQMGQPVLQGWPELGQAPDSRDTLQKAAHTMGSCNAPSEVCYSFFAPFNTLHLIFSFSIKIHSQLTRRLCLHCKAGKRNHAWHVFRDAPWLPGCLTHRRRTAWAQMLLSLYNKNGEMGEMGVIPQSKQCRGWWATGYTWEIQKRVWKRLIIPRWNKSCLIISWETLSSGR